MIQTAWREGLRIREFQVIRSPRFILKVKQRRRVEPFPSRKVLMVL